jgi:hypothetical protein
VIFSFNGIDHLSPEGRSRCFSEVARVLVDHGKFIFSSHNARRLAVSPSLRGVSLARGFLRIGYAALLSVPVAAKTLRSGSYWPGQGYTSEPEHGVIWIYTSTPRTVEPQLCAAGFEMVDVVSGPMPDPRPMWLTLWYYYACSRVPRRPAVSRNLGS